jgi:hypothetical protein
LLRLPPAAVVEDPGATTKMEAAEPELQRYLVLMHGAAVPSAASPWRYLVVFLQVALRLSPPLFLDRD